MSKEIWQISTNLMKSPDKFKGTFWALTDGNHNHEYDIDDDDEDGDDDEKP